MMTWRGQQDAGPALESAPGATSRTSRNLESGPRGGPGRSGSQFETTSRKFRSELIEKILSRPRRVCRWFTAVELGAGTALGRAAEDYRRHEEGRGLAPRGARQAFFRLARFLAYCRARRVTDPVAVTPALVLDFLGKLSTARRRSRPSLAGPLADGTCANIFRQVVRFFEFLVARDQLLLNPAAGIRPRQAATPAPGPCVTTDDVFRLVNAADRSSAVGRRDRAIVELFFGCGLRLAELVALDVDDVDFGGGVVRVGRGKGGRMRLVPAAGAALDAVAAYLTDARGELAGDRGGGALFLACGGRRLSAVSVFVRMKKLAQRAGLSAAVAPHAFRRGFATALVRGGADIASVRELLGHAKLETTQRYTIIELEDLRAVYRKTHPRERRP